MGFSVYISADMEGVAGVVSADSLHPGGSDYTRYRKLMTADVNAAVEGALDAGASEVVVNDAHGSMLNIMIEELHPEASLISGGPGSLGMMQGLDGGFSCALLVGYHSMPGGKGLFASGFSGVRALFLNGRPAGEGDVSAMIAAYFDVPVVMASGDQCVIAELRESVAQVEGAVVKRSLGKHSARCFPLPLARNAIRHAARAGCMRARQFTPRFISRPVTLEVEFFSEDAVQRAAVLPSAEVVKPATLRFSACSPLDAWGLLSTALLLGSAQDRLC